MNELDASSLPIGFPVSDWRAPPQPPKSALVGQHCRLEPLDPARHAVALFDANRLDAADRQWIYLAYGPFETLDVYLNWMNATCLGDDPQFFAIVSDDSGLAQGLASYLRIQPAAGSIEVGHLKYSPPLVRTIAATEAMFLMMQRAFDLGYRRYEWKCDALNAKSLAAAQRLGFSFEGIFRQAGVYKGRNRDTAWFSIIDREWPALRDAFQRWLSPVNFDAQGRQRVRLSELTAPIRNRPG